MFNSLKLTQKFVEPTVSSNLLSLCSTPGGATPQDIMQAALQHNLNWSSIMREVHALETAGKLKKEGANWYAVQGGRK